MIDMQSYINQTLEGLGVPVSFVARGETELPIVVFNFKENPAIYWDNEEAVTSYKITINIFSKTNFITLKNLILKKMLAAEFIKDEIPNAIYLEDDIGVYNQPMYFSFVQDVDDEITEDSENESDVKLNKLK